jgi:hypothetical protein
MAAYKDEERGTWYVSFYYEDWTGAKKRKVKRGFRTKKEALNFEAEYKRTAKADMDMTMGEFVEVYFRDKAQSLKDRSIKNKRDTTSEVRNTLKALKSSICVTAVFDMQYWEAEIWIMAEYMKTSFASSFFAVDTMSMSASSIKRKSTLLLSEAARSFIFRSATTFPVRKHLRENALLSFRFEMLIRK